MTTWDPAELAEIDAADLLVSPLRADGVTFGTPTWVWAVVVDAELHVRGYHGTSSTWFAAAMARPNGRIHAAGHTFDVTFEPAPPDRADAVDEAYRAKYAGNPFLRAMVSDKARAAGVRILPMPVAE